jgi:hypothetical protein
LYIINGITTTRTSSLINKPVAKTVFHMQKQQSGELQPTTGKLSMTATDGRGFQYASLVT